MFSNLHFYNNGILSLIDLMTMGDSSKREQSDKIGKFDSGLKYALVILHRHNINVTIQSGGFTYTFDSIVESDSVTHKAKELLRVNVTTPEGNKTQHTTAFAINMGHEWKLWMAVRELYANCLDEKGVYRIIDSEPTEQYDTHIKLDGCEDLQEIINRWDEYFLSSEPLFKHGSISVHPNPEENLKIYKNGILVYYSKGSDSRYVYDYSNADIDEMRVLRNRWYADNAICQALCSCDSIDFIQDFIKGHDDSFESSLSLDNHLSDQWVEVVNNMFKFDGEISTYEELIKNFKNDNRIDIGVRMISSQYATYSEHKVEVREVESEPEQALTFEQRVKKICSDNGVEITTAIVESQIDGMMCLGDRSKKVIHVNAEFDAPDVWEALKAEYRVLHSGNIDKIFQDFAASLKK